MFSKFLSLKKEKQERIINAAINEFAKKGYDYASTNEIVANASISKGLLFHYFENKKKLFLFLYDYCIDLYMTYIYNKINFDDKDLFLRLKYIMKIKWELMEIYPELFKFLEKAYVDSSSQVKMDIEEKNRELIDKNLKQIFNDIDYTLFKEGIDVNKAMNIIFWSFEGFGNEIQNRIRMETTVDYDELFQESLKYIEILKDCFYK